MFVKEYTMAEEHAFHVKHFCCFECDVPLGGKKYVVKHDQPICLNCCAKKYRKLLYASVWWCTCWLQSGQQGWDVCLSQDSILDIKRKEVVAIGQLDLGLVSVVGSRENEMRIMSFQVMVEVANSKIQECYTCGKLIAVEDQRVSFSYFDWHVTDSCFCCHYCSKPLAGRKFVVKKDQPLCSSACVMEFVRFRN
uniref:LIM zinc-binding domain-containing protein n=1 Tax=Timema poppense TaxID=170557 RepID=A0A7R9DLS7_TIMPO|nr:unnamed protein product [Timema poppensis]